MELKEMIEIINANRNKVEKHMYLYCKVYLNDINIFIDFKETNNKIYLSSNNFLKINDITFNNISEIIDIEFY